MELGVEWCVGEVLEEFTIGYDHTTVHARLRLVDIVSVSGYCRALSVGSLVDVINNGYCPSRGCLQRNVRCEWILWIFEHTGADVRLEWILS